jgi:hypothetical protein
LCSVTACPSGFVTATSTCPAACAGKVTVIVVVAGTVAFAVGVPPKETVAPERKYVPAIVLRRSRLQFLFEWRHCRGRTGAS